MTVISHRLSKTFALQKQFHALRNEELRIDVAELEPHGFTAGVWNPEGDRLPIMSKARYYVLISVKMAFRPTQVFSFYLMFGDFDQPQSMPVFIASDDVNLFLDPVFHHDLYGLTYVYKDNQIGS